MSELRMPKIPDEDADFTPELAREIITKYQSIIRLLERVGLDDVLSERDACADIADHCARAVINGAGSAHSEEGRKLVISTAEWIAEEIRNRGHKQ
jgi:hypothetical protein